MDVSWSKKVEEALTSVEEGLEPKMEEAAKGSTEVEPLVEDDNASKLEEPKTIIPQNE